MFSDFISRTQAAVGVVLTAGLLAGCVSTSTAPSQASFASMSSQSTVDLRSRVDAQAQAYAKNPDDPQLALGYADTLGALDRHEQQNAVLEKVVLATDGNMEAMAAYGKSLIAVGEYARADQVLSQAYTPDAPDWKVLSARGVANDKLGNHQEARQFYLQALKIQPEDPGVLTNLGLSHAFERDYGQAEVYLRRAAAQPGADQRTHENLALVLSLQGKKEETASSPGARQTKPKRSAKTGIVTPAS